ncbi:hypothetical protein MCP1_50097 [Candidatus Terasakiella magnetica]|nr:hypothetical protein MCP1_50097 [Candidatus Terasakiella magnetica]
MSPTRAKTAAATDMNRIPPLPDSKMLPDPRQRQSRSFEKSPTNFVASHLRLHAYRYMRISRKINHVFYAYSVFHRKAPPHSPSPDWICLR